MDHPIRTGVSLPTPPHVVVFPLPAQGHVNSMLKLAELLALAGFHVTFINSDQNHRCLLRHANAARFASYPGFRFETVPVGLPADHPRTGDRLIKIFDAVKIGGRELLRKLVASGSRREGGRSPVTCIVADGIMGFAIDVGKEAGVPVIHFRTISACAVWAYWCVPQLIEAGELPFQGNDMDELITSVPGMEAFLRRRDLPSFIRDLDMADPVFQQVHSLTRRSAEAHALVLNTFEDLEGSTLGHIRAQCPNVYTLGPLHALLKHRLAIEASSSKSNSLWEEDRSCVTWLDAQPPNSVVYVSFGSITPLTWDQLMEFWQGLVNSFHRFLWVIRPESIAGAGDGEGAKLKNNIRGGVAEGTSQRGYVVSWAPQEEVLAHPAVGGFLTHSGWNSTLESIEAGKPMICWPFFADQQLNSRFVSEVWKLGLDMKDCCDRSTVERMVRDLMDVKRDELVKSTAEMAHRTKLSVSQGGTSYSNFNRLIEDIKLMSMPSST